MLKLWEQIKKLALSLVIFLTSTQFLPLINMTLSKEHGFRKNVDGKM